MKDPGLQAPTHRQAAAAKVASAAGQGTHYMEHRWGARRPCRARVCVSAGSGMAGTGRLTNVSMSGAFLETALPLPNFSRVAIAMLRDDGARHVVEFAATVVRTEPDGVGLEWFEPAHGSICRLIGCAMECAAARDQ